MQFKIYLTIVPTWKSPPETSQEMYKRCDLRQECVQIANQVEKELNKMLEGKREGL